jgi:hypothetical protein
VVPLLFGLADHEFADPAVLGIIREAHKYCVKETQDRYKLPAAQELAARSGASRGHAIVVPEGYALIGDQLKPLIIVEEGITSSFFERACNTANHGGVTAANFDRTKCPSGYTVVVMIWIAAGIQMSPDVGQRRSRGVEITLNTMLGLFYQNDASVQVTSYANGNPDSIPKGSNLSGSK